MPRFFGVKNLTVAAEMHLPPNFSFWSRSMRLRCVEGHADTNKRCGAFSSPNLISQNINLGLHCYDVLSFSGELQCATNIVASPKFDVTCFDDMKFC